jgi:hypothetical protein
MNSGVFVWSRRTYLFIFNQFMQIISLFTAGETACLGEREASFFERGVCHYRRASDPLADDRDFGAAEAQGSGCGRRVVFRARRAA